MRPGTAIQPHPILPLTWTVGRPRRQASAVLGVQLNLDSATREPGGGPRREHRQINTGNAGAPRGGVERAMQAVGEMLSREEPGDVLKPGR